MPSEAEQILAVFEKFDTAKEGTMEKDALANVLKAVDPKAWTKESLDALFEVIDKKKDGIIKIEDFVKWALTFPSAGPVDISSITRVAKDDLGLLPQPENPKYKMALVQIYVRCQPFGGSDKSNNGHRYDSIPFANGMITAGMSCQLVHYVHDEHDKFFELMKSFDALIVRCNPGQIKADGGDQGKFDDAMRAIRKEGIQVWPSPDVMEFMGAKDALTKVAKMNIGLEDTLAYYETDAFIEGFKKTMAFQPRVIKQNRGSSGEGIWIIKLKEGNYCASYGERSCADDEKLELMEANDNHAEEHTVAEFIEFCINGRTDKSGEWTSKGVGKYLEGGKEAGGQLVDQRFCPRIVEGELRYNMVGAKCVGIIHKKPKEGGISAVGGTGSIYTFYGPEEEKFKNLTTGFLEKDLPKVMPALGLPDEPVPLWWTSDFILASPEGTPAEEEKWIVGEFNCSCVGISKCLPAYCKEDTPNACFDDIPAEDKAEAKKMGDMMGDFALNVLDSFLSRSFVANALQAWQDAYNKGDYDGAAAAYAASTEITVNGGVENGGPFSGKTPAEFAGFLKHMREEMKAEDMQITLTEVSGNTSKDTWTNTAGTGACYSTWEQQEDGKWKMTKDEITFVPKAAS